MLENCNESGSRALNTGDIGIGRKESGCDRKISEFKRKRQKDCVGQADECRDRLVVAPDYVLVDESRKEEF